MANVTRLTKHLETLGALKLYGLKIEDFPPAALGFPGKDVGLAQIRAYSVGNYCVPLPTPVVLVVFGNGEDVGENDICGKKGETVWSASLSQETLAIDFKKGTIGNLLEEVEIKGIDGGITIENPRIENGYVHATIHIWAKIEIFGAKASVNERIPISIPIEGCYTVYEFGFGNVQACVRAAPPSGINLCIKLCVGKWGLSKCWDACTYISMPKSTHNVTTENC
jgi:hypothetical protein